MENTLETNIWNLLGEFENGGLYHCKRVDWLLWKQVFFVCFGDFWLMLFFQTILEILLWEELEAI